MAHCRPAKPSEQLAPSSRYELILRLAAGGMGSVFLGVDRADPTTFRAIKRAHPHLMRDASFRRMFVREARLASRIDSPHAIGVLEVDDSDGELLLVMRYVEGPSFAGLLESTRLDPVDLRRAALLRVIADAARGLDAAHEMQDEGGKPLGIVHRDVSPQNILVSVSGIASIVDFGVAKAMGEVEATNTATNVVKGKLAFMAPEYLRNRISGPRSDQFSLGVVAWEALASAPLFRAGNEADTAANLLSTEEARSLDEVAAGFDPEIARVIARALKKRPEERFASTGELADALEAAAKGAGSLAEVGELGAIVLRVFGAELGARRELLAEALRAREEARAAEAMLPAQSVLRISQRPPAPVDLATLVDLPVSHARTTVRMSQPQLELGPEPAAPTGISVGEDDSTLDLPATLQHPPEPPRQAPPARSSSRKLVTVGVAIGVASALTLGFLGLRTPRDEAAKSKASDAAAPAGNPPSGHIAPAAPAAPTERDVRAGPTPGVGAAPSTLPASSASAAPGASAATSASSAPPPASGVGSTRPRPGPKGRPKLPSRYDPQGI